MSTLCSFAILRTSGEERWCNASSVVIVEGFSSSNPLFAAATFSCGGPALAGIVFSWRGPASRPAAEDPSACGDGLGGSFDGAAGAGADVAAPDPITATTLLTGTVSPSLTRISAITPA